MEYQKPEQGMSYSVRFPTVNDARVLIGFDDKRIQTRLLFDNLSQAERIISSVLRILKDRLDGKDKVVP